MNKISPQRHPDAAVTATIFLKSITIEWDCPTQYLRACGVILPRLYLGEDAEAIEKQFAATAHSICVGRQPWAQNALAAIHEQVHLVARGKSDIIAKREHVTRYPNITRLGSCMANELGVDDQDAPAIFKTLLELESKSRIYAPRVALLLIANFQTGETLKVLSNEWFVRNMQTLEKRWGARIKKTLRNNIRALKIDSDVTSEIQHPSVANWHGAMA